MRNIFLSIIIFCSSLLYANARGEQFTATIVGSGSPIFNSERAGAGVLISKGTTQILVDMGNGTQANLNKLGVEIKDLSALLFTHHHIDHNEEFVPIFIQALLGRGGFQIIGPPNTSKLAQMNLELYQEDIAYRLSKTGRTVADREKAFKVMDIRGGESFVIDDIKISTIKVKHTIHTISYRFDYDGASIVVTGDLTYSEDLPGLAKDADIMIIDSGGMIMEGSKRRGRGRNRNPGQDEKERAHVNLYESSLMAKQANVKTVVYTHFGIGKVDEEKSLVEIRKNYNGNVIFSKDLMEIRTLNNGQ